MSKKPITEWRPSDAVSAYVYLTAPKLIGEGKGRRHTATASDATGSIAVVDFRGALHGVTTKGFYAVRGTASEYNGTLQLMPDVCRPVTEDDRAHGFDEAACVLSAPEPIDAMLDELLSYHASLHSQPAEDCWALAMDFHTKRISTHPAAQSVHHDYRGGLLYHTLGMLRVGELVATVHDLDWDVLALGILFHDVGKLDEIGEWPGDDYSLEGRAQGHIYMGARAWEKVWVYLGLPTPHHLHSHVTHLILSHHGSKELGSPVTPLTREAWTLHLLDMLDSRLEIVRAATKGLAPGAVIDCWPLGQAMREWPRGEGEDDDPNDEPLDTSVGPGDGP